MILNDLHELAVRAYNGTSFDPKRRAQDCLRGYEELLEDDLENLPEDERTRYAEQFRDKVRELLTFRSNIMSAMIVGPARFPVAKNEKAMRAYENRQKAFEDWRVRTWKTAQRRAKENQDAGLRHEKEWKAAERDIFRCAATCGGIDSGKIVGTKRELITGNLSGKIARYANNGKVELVKKCLDYIKQVQESKEFGLKKPLFTSRHNIWRLDEIAVLIAEKNRDIANRGNEEMQFGGGKIVANRSEDRLQIIYDEKPSSEMISKLKHNGFRWSPRFGAWQRQLTRNAVLACKSVIPDAFAVRD